MVETMNVERTTGTTRTTKAMEGMVTTTKFWSFRGPGG